MIKHSLFADQEREAKLNKLGDTLRVLEQHVDFSALAAAVDAAPPHPGRERDSRPPFPTELMVPSYMLSAWPISVVIRGSPWTSHCSRKVF